MYSTHSVIGKQNIIFQSIIFDNNIIFQFIIFDNIPNYKN